MSVYLQDGDLTLHHGNAATVLADLPEGSVDCVVTSPPYFGLRDYGVECQIGLEPTPEEYVAALVAVFREVWRVLAPWGTCWVNIGDSYATGSGGYREGFVPGSGGDQAGARNRNGAPRGDAKPKDLLMMPARLALALQADGWWVRSRIVWAKPNPMPESVTDRPTSAHEDVYLLTKAARYYYDAEAVREPHAEATLRMNHTKNWRDRPNNGGGNMGGEPWRMGEHPNGRNMRNVWSIATEPTPEAHFATFPTELVRRCLAGGCPERVCRECGEPSRRIVEREVADARYIGTKTQHNGDRNDGGRSQMLGASATTTGWSDCGHDAWRPGIVLDPFMGSGTTALVARRLGLHAVGIDASAEYLAIAAKRLQQLSLLGGAA